MQKVLVVANLAYMIKQFCMSNIQILMQLGYKVEVACNFETGNPMSKKVIDSFSDQLKSQGILCHQIGFRKSPLSIRENRRAHTDLRTLVASSKFAFIHCQSPIAGVLARKVGRDTGTPIIYTAHGFHFQKNGSKLNWLIYFPVEWALSFYTDLLILITKEDYHLAKKRMKARRIEYVPGVGVSVNGSTITESLAVLKNSLGLPKEAFVLLSIGELNKNKNHAAAVRSIVGLPSVHYIIAGVGLEEKNIKQTAEKLGVSDRVHLLGFRSDVQRLYAVADVYCQPSHREGLSVAVMEAMANHLPVVCFNIRGNRDLIVHDEGGYLIRPGDEEGFAQAIGKLQADSTACRKLGNYNAQKVLEFGHSVVDQKMRDLYLSFSKAI